MLPMNVMQHKPSGGSRIWDVRTGPPSIWLIESQGSEEGLPGILFLFYKRLGTTPKPAVTNKPTTNIHGYYEAGLNLTQDIWCSYLCKQTLIALRTLSRDPN